VLDAPAKKSDISTYASAFDALLAPSSDEYQKPAWGIAHVGQPSNRSGVGIFPIAFEGSC